MFHLLNRLGGRLKRAQLWILHTHTLITSMITMCGRVVRISFPTQKLTWWTLKNKPIDPPLENDYIQMLFFRGITRYTYRSDDFELWRCLLSDKLPLNLVIIKKSPACSSCLLLFWLVSVPQMEDVIHWRFIGLFLLTSGMALVLPPRIQGELRISSLIFMLIRFDIPDIKQILLDQFESIFQLFRVIVYDLSFKISLFLVYLFRVCVDLLFIEG